MGGTHPLLSQSKESSATGQRTQNTGKAMFFSHYYTWLHVLLRWTCSPPYSLIGYKVRKHSSFTVSSPEGTNITNIQKFSKCISKCWRKSLWVLITLTSPIFLETSTGEAVSDKPLTLFFFFFLMFRKIKIPHNKKSLSLVLPQTKQSSKHLVNSQVSTKKSTKTSSACSVSPTVGL